MERGFVVDSRYVIMKKFLLALSSTITLMLLSTAAFAQDAAGARSEAMGMTALAAGICMCIGTLGGALSQARTAAAALEGIARNPQSAPKVQTPMIIALAMTESLVLFALVIAFFLQGKVVF
jgi:F-type H+-transporting ATPase subunit c